MPKPNDILGYELPEGCEEPPAEPMSVPTGLNDEDDARRYLAQTFSAGFHCKRCDGYWKQEQAWCPACALRGWHAVGKPMQTQPMPAQPGLAQRAAARKRRWKAPWQA